MWYNTIEGKEILSPNLFWRCQMLTQERPIDSLSVLEAAAKYGVHPETVRRWAREGRIAAQKVGNMIFVRPSDVDELMHTREKEEITING